METGNGHKIQAIKRAHIYTNIAYLLADVCDTYMVEVENIISGLSKEVNYGERKEFKKMLEEARALKQRAKKIASPVYGLKDAQAAVEDSDWLFEILTLLVDRIGDNGQKAEQVKKMLLGIETELHL